MLTGSKLVKQNKGLIYENQVYQSFCSCEDITPLSTASAGFSRHGVGDISFICRDITCHLEVKLNHRAQMGSSQLVYNHDSRVFTPHPNALLRYQSCVLSELITACSDSLVSPLTAYFNSLALPATLPRKFTSIERLHVQQLKLGKQVRLVFATPIETIANFYQSKGVHYMLIGSRGLFAVGADIFMTNAPKLTGTAVIEVRLKYNSTNRVELAITNRIVSLDNSPVMLQDVQSMRKVFNCK